MTSVLRCIIVLAMLTMIARWGTARGADPDAERTDLEKVYDVLSVEDKANEVQKRLIRTVFDLGRPEVTKIMLAALNAPPRKRGEKEKYPGGPGKMASIVCADPEKGLGWLLDHYPDLNADGRVWMMFSLKHVEHAECLDIIVMQIKDVTVVKKVVMVAEPEGASNLRVADHAYNTLMDYCSSIKKMSEGFEECIRRTTPLTDRDQSIAKFEGWWKDNRNVVVKNLPTLPATSTVLTKMDAVRMMLEKPVKK